ncbi:peptide/nickel transport system substrate-binding protein [Paenibacillus forsythiae]|uniref:Peptide/nickel transport system substrate-binding protein n=2 Tax=Paenibacillus forsythiae TaxID=365616 RepID=A0ABU3H627_9BACL|nr:nickel ABC transporter substrate-binding protein [Paenibacillus forsythiae]MDT3426278.1 peptide/nickel transport system substrate-binding protein [Paenibacillus forsythiae]
MFIFKKIRFVSLLLALALTACSPQDTPAESDASTSGEDKSITLLFNVQSNTIDPHTDVNYTAVRAGIAETLVTIDNDLKLRPALAESWSSVDGQNWTFLIRKGATFHNGKPVDAAAVQASLKRAQELNPSVRNSLHIREMKSDGQVLTLVTEQPDPQLPSSLVHPNTAVLAIESTEGMPVGTGPFQFLSFKPASELNVERNRNYWGGTVRIARAKFAFNEDANARLLAIQAKSADIVYRPPIESFDQLRADPSLTLESLASLRTHQLIYNFNHADLKQEAVRRAFDALIDREAIVSGIMNGQATSAAGPFLAEAPFSPKYTPKAFDLAAARQSFAAAGYQVDNGRVLQDGQPLAFRLLTYQARAELPLIAQLIQANARELGITVDIRLVDNIDEYLAANNDWDLAVYSSITAPRGDASYFLNAAYTPEGALNYAHVHQPELEVLIGKLNAAISEGERNAIAQEAVGYIDKHVLNSYIIHPNHFVVYSNHVKNWVTSKSEYYLLTKDLDIE